MNETPESSEEITRPILTRLNEDGSHSAQSVLTPTQLKTRAECLITPRRVIPVIFLPGIMGTRLRSAKNPDRSAWNPPNSTWDTLLAALQYSFTGPVGRQKALNPKETEVDDSGPAKVPDDTAVLLGDAPGNTNDERTKQRGWGQVHEDSYNTILSVLEQRLAHLFSNGRDIDTRWKSAVMDWQDERDWPRAKATGDAQGEPQRQSGAQRLGALKDFKALDDAALRVAARAYYPVYAVGYNWLQSNQDSGKRVASEIRRITASYRQRKKLCDKVIVVTHSMGGLVVRSAMQEEGMQEAIMGVVHGVMPAIGAPAVYKRMRAGFEDAAQVVLGRNAAETTAVMANSPGGLELLPTPQYKARDDEGVARHWLRASVRQQSLPDQAPERFTALGEGDCYQNIYLNKSAWWRMVKEELINPVGREEREKAKREGKDPAEDDIDQSDLKKYAKVVQAVRDFHSLIEDKYHPVSYASYAHDAERRSWSEVRWKCEQLLVGDYTGAEMVADDQNGKVQLKLDEDPNTYRFEIQDAAGPGDGTVPAESGAAPLPHVLQMFRHEGKAKGHTSYDHQGSYKADVVQAVTLYAIARIAADSAWLQQEEAACAASPAPAGAAGPAASPTPEAVGP